MENRPTAPEILAAIETFLREDVIPEVSTGTGHQVRVAASLCAILRREWHLRQTVGSTLAVDRPGYGAGG